jgi:hypothetical protein
LFQQLLPLLPACDMMCQFVHVPLKTHNRRGATTVAELVVAELVVAELVVAELVVVGPVITYAAARTGAGL